MISNEIISDVVKEALQKTASKFSPCFVYVHLQLDIVSYIMAVLACVPMELAMADITQDASIVAGQDPFRLGNFTSKSGCQRTSKLKNLVVQRHLWSSSYVFLLKNSRKKLGKWRKKHSFYIVNFPVVNEDDQNLFLTRPHQCSSHHTRGHLPSLPLPRNCEALAI